MKRVFPGFAIGVVLLANCLYAAEETPPALTLADAVRMALKHHPDVETARASADILKGKIREVRSQALPNVSFNYSFVRWRDPSLLNASGIDKFPAELRDALIPTAVNLFDYNISVKQPVYTAGKVGTALRLASVEADGAR
ncbi:MAG: TolC family protein, partial [Acidobacteria bacterium]|nr:TolC family protein [Acidobacteriota bacterium]